MPRAHDRDYFYKFMTAKTAMKILSTSSLRYSSPLKFNDPFDHQVEFVVPFTQEDFAKGLLEEICRIVYDDSVVIQNPTAFGAVNLLLRRTRDRVPREQLISELSSSADETASRLKAGIGELNKQLTATLLHSRVLCVTEEIDNVVMWSHYADEHRGVAMRLHCIDEVDNTLLVARPVKYVDQFPEFPSIVNYARHLTGEVRIDFPKKIYEESAFTKHKNWAYEREWRVHVPLINEPVGTGYSDWREHSRTFGAIYMGCRMPQQDTQSLLGIIKERMPHMEVHQARTSRTKFGIEHERVK